MRKNKLLQKLQTYAGEEELEFIIPYPLLPPRFYNTARGRNMLLQVSTDLQIYVRWEGCRIEEWTVLTPRGARALLRDVGRKLGQYGKDVLTFSHFLYENAIHPAPDPLFDDPSERAVPEEAEPLGQKEDPKVVVGQGGESPWPLQEF